jgi:hypothetical protein
MADWNASLFQIITALIGGSVFAFVLNAANTDFNQPHFVITSNNTHSYENMSTQNTVLRNDGRSEATNVRFTLVLFDPDTRETNKIINASKKTITENFTLHQEDDQTLIANIPRLAEGSQISIESNTSKPATYVATAASDQGTENAASEAIRQNKTKYPFFAADPDGISFSTQIIIILLVVAIGFLLASLYRRIRKFVIDDSAEFVSKLRKEIKIINDTLERKSDSKKIFNLETWSTTDSSLKLRTFNDLENYKRIDSFYKSIKGREDSLLNDRFNNETLLKSNKELADISNSVLEVVTNYAKRFQTKKLVVIFSITSPIILGLLVLLYVLIVNKIFS